MDVADRPPVGAWGHTYREEWSPEELAAVTVERARRLGWDFVKFQPRASSFAEAFGSVYHPSGHRLRGPVLIRSAVPDLDSWAAVKLVNRQALDDQVESIRLVVRGLGHDLQPRCDDELYQRSHSQTPYSAACLFPRPLALRFSDAPPARRPSRSFRYRPV